MTTLMRNRVASRPTNEQTTEPRQSGPSGPLHRLAKIRRREGVSLRGLANRLRMRVSEVKTQEEADCDLPLSSLYRWQEALGVPVSELLVDADSTLSDSVAQRAHLVRVMKTAVSIEENANSSAMQNLARNLKNQLVQIMPELQDVLSWHTIGQQRTREDLGRIAERTYPDTLFFEAG